MGLKKEYLAVVKFLDMYYGIFIENFNKEIMIGKDLVWFRDDGFMHSSPIDRINLPYNIEGIRTKAFNSTGVYYDLKSIDADFKIFRFKDGKFTDIGKYNYSSMYLILLGITFYSSFFNEDETKVFMFKYFMDDYTYHFKRNKEIEGINPFKGLAKYKNGTIKKRRFY